MGGKNSNRKDIVNILIGKSLFLKVTTFILEGRRVFFWPHILFLYMLLALVKMNSVTW